MEFRTQVAFLSRTSPQLWSWELGLEHPLGLHWGSKRVMNRDLQSIPGLNQGHHQPLFQTRSGSLSFLISNALLLVLVTSVAIWSLQNNPVAFLLGLQKHLHFHCSPGWSISCLGCNCLSCLHFTIYVYNWLLRAELLLSPKILCFTAYLAFPGNFRGDELSEKYKAKW